MSPTDPPLPPSPDEPSDEPRWGEGEGAEPSDAGVTGGDDELADAADGAVDLPPDEADTDLLASTADEPTDLMPPTGDEPTDLMQVTGDEPTDVMVAAAAVAPDGTGEITRAHRRRVSHRRYVMRRIGVAIAALAVAGGGVALLLALTDDDRENADSVSSTTPATSEPIVATPTTRAGTTTDAPTTTARSGDVATTSVETSEEATAPATTEEEETEVEATEPASEETDPESSEDTTATESSPPGTVEYDLTIDPTCTIGQTLRRGDTGPQVECLQERLNEITVDGIPFAVDGAFGEQTEDAVRSFQAAQQLGVDGIVGPTTGGALGIWPE